MATLQTYDTPDLLAKAAALRTVSILGSAIELRARAVWVAAGGTSPAATYDILARDFSDKLPWRQVAVLMGDERAVPPDHEASNWKQLQDRLLEHVPVPSKNRLRPETELPADEAARRYEAVVADFPVIDLLWLGIGEDGHTLSLFPGHPALQETKRLVIPVRDVPKPPPERITLTFKALERTRECLIFAAGKNKTGIVRRCLAGDTALPVAQAIKVIERAGGKVTWLTDNEVSQT